MSVRTSNPKGTPIATAYAGYFISYLSLGMAPIIMSWVSGDPKGDLGQLLSCFHLLGAFLAAACSL